MLTRDARLKTIERKKLVLTPEALCQGLPKQMTNYFNYTRRLKPFEKPDYEYLKKLMGEMATSTLLGN